MKNSFESDDQCKSTKHFTILLTNLLKASPDEAEIHIHLQFKCLHEIVLQMVLSARQRYIQEKTQHLVFQMFRNREERGGDDELGDKRPTSLRLITQIVGSHVALVKAILNDLNQLLPAFTKPSDGGEAPHFFRLLISRWLLERQFEIRRMFEVVLKQRQKESGNKKLTEK